MHEHPQRHLMFWVEGLTQLMFIVATPNHERARVNLT